MVGETEPKVTVRLLVDAVVNGEPKKTGDEVEVTVGEAGRFTSVDRAVIVSAYEEEKLPAVGSVAGVTVETKQVEVENTPKNDLQHVPVDTPVVAKTAKSPKATPVTPAATS